ncbi:DUF2271 domain-containing protein [Saccharomonospora sp. NPDC046836]|uniref:DUF2271 domain-containing protein n=1 Tax=Saccharomonospora sp. NPDC046836 TaxID=3156921 RepID=UPI0033DE6369
MRATTVRIVLPAVVLTGVVGAAGLTQVLAEADSAPPPASALTQGTPAPDPGSVQASAALGLLRIDYHYERQGRSASNQYAIWIEDEAGDYVASVFATSWIGHGGYTRRPMGIPTWRGKANWAEATQAQIEAVVRPVPGTGDQVIYWNGLDAQGAPVPSGTYRVRIEGNVEWERMVEFSASFTVGTEASEVTAEEVRNDQPEDRMISGVRVSFLPGEPLTTDMVTEYTRGS